MAWLGGLLRKSTIVNIAFAGIVFALFVLENRRLDVTLHDVQFFNGWVLVSCMTLMMFLTSRKRVIILPFGRVRFWLLLHYYAGFLAVGAFLVHTKFQLPDSPVEWLLWALFVLVAGSGLFGALMAKIIPPRLEGHGERVLFDRIPVFRNDLANQAEMLARESVRDGNESIARLYVDTLGYYFAGPRNIVLHLRASNVPRTRILGELSAIERYLDQAGRGSLGKIRELVEAKNNLDFHYANNGLLRLWLFLHVPPTYAMIVVAVVHVLQAYAFSTS